jgi:sulfite exporter TauE/SafE/copper chaperone CopZ
MSTTGTSAKGIKMDLFVEGMHCAACEMVIEKKLKKLTYLSDIDATLKNNQVHFRVNGTVSQEKIIKEANALVNDDGYRIVSEPAKHEVNYRELLIGFLLAAVVMMLFFAMQKLGIANILGGKTLSLPLIFLIGIVASLSTCMAVVGGLVLSLSSSYAQSNNRTRPLLLFHISRLAGFFILGGFVGLIGSAFTISPEFYFVISVILFIVMLILGLNLLDVIPFFRKLQLRMPKAMSGKILDKASMQNKFMPILLGAATFFLPCGFTQSMQVNAMASGNIITGAVIMLTFALGTLPVLSLISFSSFKLSASGKSGIFFKTAGFLVLFFALFNFLSALVGAGLIDPIF